MRTLGISLSTIVVAILLSGCAPQPGSNSASMNSVGSTIPAHQVKPNVFSTTIYIKNAYSEEILNGNSIATLQCWTAPSSWPNILAGGLAGPYTLSYDPTCAGSQYSYHVIYGTDYAHVDICSLVVTAHPDTQTFTYAISHDTTTYTDCSWVAQLDGSIKFTYNETKPAVQRAHPAR